MAKDVQKTTSQVATSVKDFIVLPIRTTNAPLKVSRPSTHYLYLHANVPRIPTADTPRELFLVNLPPDVTEAHLRSLFATELGGSRIEKVVFARVNTRRGIKTVAGKKRKRHDHNDSEDDEEQEQEEIGKLPEIWDRTLQPSGSSATVTFVDKPSADLVMKETRRVVKTGREIIWGKDMSTTLPALGLGRYATHHRLRFPDPTTLQSSMNTYMAAFSARETALAKFRSQQRSVPDEDGFITVTRGGRNGTAKAEAAEEARNEELRRKAKNAVKDDFYRFQTREKKKEAAQEMIKGYEEDARRLQEMKRRKGKVRLE